MSGAKLGMIVLINIMMIATIFMIQTSMSNIALDMGLDRFEWSKVDTSNLDNYHSGDYDLDVNIASVIQSLPVEGNAGDVDEGGNWFTDTFKSIKNWLLGVTGVQYVINILNTVPNFVATIFPNDFKIYGFALGYIWYAITIFTLVFWIRGGGQ